MSEHRYLSKPPALSDPIRFEIYYGVSSPWALLGAPEAERIASKYGIKIHLKPIVVVEENGGIRLKTRHPARQAYHALDLYRTSKFLGMTMKAFPKYYPQPAGTIEIAGQAIIRIQRKFGVGSPEALKFSYEIQRCIWITEQGDHSKIETLQQIAREIGSDEETISECVVDCRGDEEDEGVKEWKRNHEEAVELGIFGTPNYVVNGEIFWGQDRLHFVEMRIKELVEAGAKPVQYP
ncbi:uncharacterized protein I303_104482 [Kwoniella dejecticola CBS 10117]|uniref:Glutathione S-transferase kappa n=1 Tax=Kwoniella dejecticola CBS 10117 TaxID=1296121 RepID=A0A1A6A590_9TREE|nr:uncharacterized protein I303_04540 [Kwoniella dejecticola CBS 10117]OBR85208.1 hypothetical protein I303_04540 [Kwoniella dejecticola CBS 10117]